MTRLLSSLMSDSEGQNPCYPFANVSKTEKKSHEGSVKKTWKRSLLGSTQLEVRLLREQRGKVRFAQGLRQKAQQRHQTRLWGCQTISDHVRLSMPCFSGFSQVIPWKTTISWPPHCTVSTHLLSRFTAVMASLEESVAATSSSSGVPVFRSSTWT